MYSVYSNDGGDGDSYLCRMCVDAGGMVGSISAGWYLHCDSKPDFWICIPEDYGIQKE